MYIDTVPNRHSPPCLLLRESYRVGDKVYKRTLLNLTHWPPQLVEDFRSLLNGGSAVGELENSFDIVRSRAHGHVAAVLGTLRRLGVDKRLAGRRCRERDLVAAMIVQRILQPGSKLAAARELDEWSGSTTLADLLEVQSATEDELYAALDWLGNRQDSIEQALADQHLSDGVLVLYDVTSTYFEGRTCPLACYGYSRDGQKDKLQIVFGLLCTGEGIPVAVEVFEGNTKDCMTVAAQIHKIRERFSLSRVVFVGDRGMLTEARLRDDVRPVEGLDWITALTTAQIRGLVQADALQLSLFDEQDLAEIRSPDYPGERLVACRNPLLAEERARKREELLQATEMELDKIVAATQREKRPLRGRDRIGLRVGKVLGRFKVAKHFRLTITDTEFTYERDTERIEQEAKIDGIYIIRTSVNEATLDAGKVVGSYKRLSTVERAFRSMKTVDLKVRPIYHHLTKRVRAHVFLCMLAYYVEWHMRQALAPLLFDDDDQETAVALRDSIVAPAQRSPQAVHKAQTKRTADGFPVQSFHSLLQCLATLTLNRHQPNDSRFPAFDKITLPNPLQQRALDLLHVHL
jgi:transposase